MKHRLYLPTFLPVSFPDAMETFLEDMAKKVWFLKKVGYFLSFCQFEKGTPAPVRYRLEPIPDTVRTPSAEMVQFYEEFGWKYLTPFSHFFFIFVAKNPDTPEIHCDPLVQAKGYKRMCRNFSVFGLAALVLLTIFLGIPLYHPSFLLERPRFSAFALVTLLSCCFDSLVCPAALEDLQKFFSGEPSQSPQRIPEHPFFADHCANTVCAVPVAFQ